MSHVIFTGLVVCGGASSRMGMDKSLIRYYDKEQRYHIADMLGRRCPEVLLSLNDTQQSQNEKYNIIRDLPQYRNNGPIAAILSAFHAHPQSDLIVIGCDYPLFTEKELYRFMDSVTDHTQPLVFFNEADGFYEPLLGYYPASIASVIRLQFEEGNTSLQKILKQISCGRYFPENKYCMQSVDDPATSERIKQRLNIQKKNGS